VDFLFEALEEREPNHFALRQYKKFKLAAGKTAKSILISCGARLSPFDIAEVRELLSEDELELDKIGRYKKYNPKTKKDEVAKEKTALFVIISDTDDSLNFIAALMYSQLFNLMCDRADNEFGGRLPVPTRIILDEFANIGLIPKFEKLIATIRSREIPACIILQSQSQLKAIYKDNMENIIGNCDAMLFLGGKEKTTLEEISKMLGKETIDMYSTSVTKGTQESHGQNFQKHGKDLMSVDEIAVMDGGRCILQLRGECPFFSVSTISPSITITVICPMQTRKPLSTSKSTYRRNYI
jgi:type IV secretion system protein VirD4